MWIESPPQKKLGLGFQKIKQNITLDHHVYLKQFKDTFFMVLVINYMLYKARDATVGICKP